MFNLQKDVLRSRRRAGGGGGSAIVLDDSQVNVGNCTDCKTVTVTVPASSTYEIQIIKSGAASYAGASLTACMTGTNLSVDQTFSITASQTFRFGIDASTGTANSSTTITFIVRNSPGGSVIDSTNLTRTHESPVINC